MTRITGRRMSIDQLMNQAQKGGRGKGAKFLNRWKKDVAIERVGTSRVKVAKIDVVLAGEEPITEYYSHNIPQVVTTRKKGSKETENHLWSREWMCLESDEVLDARRFRNDDGTREKPPERCPICILIEMVRQSIVSGDLDWLTPIFVFGAEGVQESEVEILAGGICGMFGDDDLSGEEKKQLEEADIKQSVAWKQSLDSRSQYLMTVVDYEDPDSGVQITREAKSLGMALEATIAREIEGSGEKGHPTLNPYVFRFKYLPDNLMSDKYDVVTMRELTVSPEMRKLVSDGPFPDLARALEYNNVKTLRAWLEKCAVIEMPWDEIFAPALEVCDANGIPQLGQEAGAKDEFDRGSDGGTVDEGGSDGESQSTGDAGNVDGLDEVPCDACGKMMRGDLAACPHCGERYGFEDETSKVEEKKPEPEKKKLKATVKGKSDKPAAKPEEKAEPKAAKTEEKKPAGKVGGKIGGKPDGAFKI